MSHDADKLPPDAAEPSSATRPLGDAVPARGPALDSAGPVSSDDAGRANGDTSKIPVKKSSAEAKTPDAGRRDFFAEGLREVLRPVAHVIDRRLKPMLDALEQLPLEVERMAGAVTNNSILGPISGPLDQPQAYGTVDDLGGRFAPVEVPAVVLRPPGALDPGDFETQCSRCGKCVEVCPAKAIKIDLNGHIGGGFPYIIPAEMPCVVCEPLACMHECPSGALRIMDRLQLGMGTAKVDHGLCRRTQGEDCRLCADACPIGAAAIDISEGTGRVRVKRNACVGCGVCEQSCPTQPRAITVTPRAKLDAPIVA